MATYSDQPNAMTGQLRRRLAIKQALSGDASKCQVGGSFSRKRKEVENFPYLTWSSRLTSVLFLEVDSGRTGSARKAAPRPRYEREKMS